MNRQKPLGAKPRERGRGTSVGRIRNLMACAVKFSILEGKEVMMRHLRLSLFVLGLSLFSLPATVRAADLDKLLPDDTDSIMSVNVRQILDSAIVKKYALDNVKESMVRPR
jgi:hypothetical protein